MRTNYISRAFRILLLISLATLISPTENAGEAWYEIRTKQKYKVEKNKEATTARPKITKKRKKTKNEIFWRIVLGVSLSLFLVLFPYFHTLFILPLCITFIGIIFNFYVKPKPQKPKIRIRRNRRNQILWTVILATIATLFFLAIGGFSTGVLLFSLIPTFVASLSLFISNQSVKNGKSGKSCLTLSIIISVSFILLAAGVLILIIYAFS